MFRFDFTKTLQATAVLLRSHPLHAMGRLRLLKLLYIADRESLKETGMPITGDRMVALPHGPVLSATYNLIKGEHIRVADWARCFESVGSDVRLLADPGTGRLSRYEIETLTRVTRQFEHEDDWGLAEKTHEFEEWKKNNPGRSSTSIPFEDILRAVGRGKDIDAIRREAKVAAFADRLFGGS